MYCFKPNPELSKSNLCHKSMKEVPVMNSFFAHLAIYFVLLLPIGNSRLLLVELGDDAKGIDNNSSTGLGMGSPMAVPRSKTTKGLPIRWIISATLYPNHPNSKLGNRGLLRNLFGAAANLFRRVDDFGTNIAMTGIKHGVNLAKGTFLVCHLMESGIPTSAIYALCT